MWARGCPVLHGTGWPLNQDPAAIKAVWAANLKALNAEARAKLDAHQAQWNEIHGFLRDPARLNEDMLDLIIDLVIEDVEDFVKSCPLSPGCNGGNVLDIYDQMLYYGEPRDEHFSEFMLDEMPSYFKKYGLLLDYTDVLAFRSFQTAIVRWFKKNRHRPASEFEWWSEDVWAKIEQYAKNVPNFNDIRCCDDYDSSAPRCTANPNCWRSKQTSAAPQANTNAIGLTPAEVNLRRKLATTAFDFQRKVEKQITELDPSQIYSGLVSTDDREN